MADTKVWNVYFRNKEDDSLNWELQCSIPQMVVETFEKNGVTSPGDQWYSDGPLDLGEGRAATLVLRNQRYGLDSRYALEDHSLAPQRTPPRETVTFSVTLH